MIDAVRLAVPQVGMWEGRIPWLYRDTRGNVTVAMGRMLPNMMAAFSLPFDIELPHGILGRASKTEIEADWRRIMAMPFGPKCSARYYRDRTSVFLGTQAIDAMAIEDLNRCHGELCQDFPTFEQMPLNAQVVLLDMDYNLGETKLRHKYPRFNGAADCLDFARMAAECHREGIQDKRNQWARDTLLQCAAAACRTAANEVRTPKENDHHAS